MTVARNVAEILDEHTTLEVECIDRMYVNLYVPILQREAGIAHFWQAHRGHRFASGTQMGPMGRAFISSIEQFADREGIPLIKFKAGQRKDDIAKKYLEAFRAKEGVFLIGKAQEKTRVSPHRETPESENRADLSLVGLQHGDSQSRAPDLR